LAAHEDQGFDKTIGRLVTTVPTKPRI
jgi:hypothetical protein